MADEKLTTDELIAWFHSAGPAWEAIRAVHTEAEAQKKKADVLEKRLEAAMKRESELKTQLEAVNSELRSAKDEARDAQKAREDAEMRIEGMESHPEVREARAAKFLAEADRLRDMAAQMTAPILGAKEVQPE